MSQRQYYTDRTKWELNRFLNTKSLRSKFAVVAAGALGVASPYILDGDTIEPPPPIVHTLEQGDISPALANDLNTRLKTASIAQQELIDADQAVYNAQYDGQKVPAALSDKLDNARINYDLQIETLAPLLLASPGMTETGLKTYLEKWYAGNHDRYGISFDGTDPAALNECRAEVKRQKDQTLDEYSGTLNSCMRTLEKNILAKEAFADAREGRDLKNQLGGILFGTFGIIFALLVHTYPGRGRKTFSARPEKKNYTKQKLKS